MNIYELADMIVEWWENYEKTAPIDEIEPAFVTEAYKIQEERT